MKNKRIKKRNRVEMIRNVKPVRVSPTIKAARWILLLLGIVHGYTRLQSLRKCEEKAGPIRRKKYAEEHAREKAIEKKRFIDDIKELAKRMDVNLSDMPPGWEDDV